MSVIVDFYRFPAKTMLFLGAQPERFGAMIEKDQASAGYSEHLCLEKMWEGINFLLTGSTTPILEGDPLEFVYSGRPVIETEYGMAPPIGMSVEEVRAAADALTQVDIAACVGQVTVDTLVEHAVYPFMPGENDDDVRQELSVHMKAAQDFFVRASNARETVVKLYM